MPRGGGGGPCGKECPACMLTQGAGELGEGEVSWTSAFTGVRMEYTSERLEGISLVPLNVTSRRVVQEEVVAGSSLITLSTGCQSQDVYSPFVGCRSTRKTDVLKIYNMHPLYC